MWYTAYPSKDAAEIRTLSADETAQLARHIEATRVDAYYVALTPEGEIVRCAAHFVGRRHTSGVLPIGSEVELRLVTDQSCIVRATRYTTAIPGTWHYPADQITTVHLVPHALDGMSLGDYPDLPPADQSMSPPSPALNNC